MKELKVGMYVRTKDGLIDKVIIDYKGCCNSPNCNCKHVSCEHNYYDEENIIKASYNLIDLIEVGDYVNGKRVYNISIVDGLKYLDVEVEDYLSDMPFINADQITSIVTKEQFNSVKYEVE